MKKRKKPALDAEMQLHTLPCKNIHVKTWENEEATENLIVQVKLKPNRILALAMKILKAKDTKTYSLVGVARNVYEAIDGKRTVEDLVDLLMRDFKLTFLESRAMTVQYLSDLMKRGLVVILPPGALHDNLPLEKAPRR